MPTQIQNQIVLLVHGTYASQDADVGEEWWQVDSDFHKSLKSALPSNIIPHQCKEVFHWSGENEHLFCLAAAVDLLRRLKELEESDTPYHIVAHSHGGSVVWQALNLSHFVFNISESTWAHTWEDLRRFFGSSPPSKYLSCLKSVTTVGTPFIQFQESNFRRWVSFSTGLVLALGAFISGSGVALGVGVSFGVGYGLALFFAALPLLAVGQRMIITSGAFNAERYADLTVEQYGQLWKGIWSWDDEALALLKSALTIANAPTFAPKAKKAIPSNLVAHGQGVFLFPERIMSWVYDRIITSRLDRALKSRLSCLILGTRSLKPVTTVEPWPHESLRRDTTLSLGAQVELKASADLSLAESSTNFRPFLQYLAVGEVERILADFEKQKGFLIHNCYFESTEVRRLIADHIVKKA